jgi:hypothetical protein
MARSNMVGARRNLRELGRKAEMLTTNKQCVPIHLPNSVLANTTAILANIEAFWSINRI